MGSWLDKELAYWGKVLHLQSITKMETSRVQTKQSKTREHGTTKVTVRMKQCFESKWSICVSTKILITASQSRTGNGNFWKWSDKFQSDRTDRSKRTTSGGGEFPCRLKHSIYFSTEASENFGRIKSTHSLLFNFIKIMQRDFYHHLGSIHSTHIYWAVHCRCLRKLKHKSS